MRHPARSDQAKDVFQRRPSKRCTWTYAQFFLLSFLHKTCKARFSAFRWMKETHAHAEKQTKQYTQVARRRPSSDVHSVVSVLQLFVSTHRPVGIPRLHKGWHKVTRKSPTSLVNSVVAPGVVLVLVTKKTGMIVVVQHIEMNIS